MSNHMVWQGKNAAYKIGGKCACKQSRDWCWIVLTIIADHNSSESGRVLARQVRLPIIYALLETYIYTFSPRLLLPIKSLLLLPLHSVSPFARSRI